MSSWGLSPSPLPLLGSSSFLDGYEDGSFISSTTGGGGGSYILKNRIRFADSGIWNPHCHPEATFLSSVGTLTLLLNELIDGHSDTTCCTLGYIHNHGS